MTFAYTLRGLAVVVELALLELERTLTPEDFAVFAVEPLCDTLGLLFDVAGLL